IAVFVYMAYQRFNKKSNVTQRIQISSVHRSQHFYEEPAKTKDHDNVIKIPVPDVAKARKAAYSHQQQSNPEVVPSIPVISLHPSSNSTINTVKKLPTFETKSIQSASVNSTVWDLDDINEFTQNMFRNNNDNKDNLKPRSYRLRLNCPIDPDDYLKEYIQSRSHCLDIFEDYVNSLKRQHGMIKSADSDPPIFDPGISVTGPQVKKETSVIDKEDSHVIKKLNRAEPRKKYALVHEQIGIFIIGGYNLYSDIPVQKEPNTDYLFKFNGDVVEIPPLKPCRIHFGIYTDGEGIYIGGGQTIKNELLDDIQCFNLRTLTWKHIATLMNPIAACGMTLDDNRIYLVGGYDIVRNHTILLADYTIYNLSSQRFEKSTNLPSPRCRSLVFATDNAIFCISGLCESSDANYNKKMKISTKKDILKWTQKSSQWIKVSQTPELTKFHALSFNDPYLEVTKRDVNDQGDEIGTLIEAHYNFQTNQWTNGRAPTAPSSSSSPSIKAKDASQATKSPAKSTTIKTSKKTPSKSKARPSATVTECLEELFHLMNNNGISRRGG
ncbi:unnamed protein product, partial [Adineta steineri]